MADLKFQFDEEKAVATLAYVASKWPRVTAFYAAKIIFFAEKMHLNRYARPIFADTFVAMTNGPVPSTVYDFLKGQLSQAGDPEAIQAALRITRKPYPMVEARNPPDLSSLSTSDIECLDEALAFCRQRTFSVLSSLTHQERAWAEAPVNGPMDYAAMIDADNPAREQILEEAQEFALYGSL